MKNEIFYTPGCSECSAAHGKLRTVAQKSVKDLEWHELFVLDDFDYAVELGVLTLPSFQPLPRAPVAAGLLIPHLA